MKDRTGFSPTTLKRNPSLAWRKCGHFEGPVSEELAAGGQGEASTSLHGFPHCWGEGGLSLADEEPVSYTSRQNWRTVEQKKDLFALPRWLPRERIVFYSAILIIVIILSLDGFHSAQTEPRSIVFILLNCNPFRFLYHIFNYEKCIFHIHTAGGARLCKYEMEGRAPLETPTCLLMTRKGNF